MNTTTKYIERALELHSIGECIQSNPMNIKHSIAFHRFIWLPSLLRLHVALGTSKQSWKINVENKKPIDCKYLHNFKYSVIFCIDQAKPPHETEEMHFTWLTRSSKWHRICTNCVFIFINVFFFSFSLRCASILLISLIILLHISSFTYITITQHKRIWNMKTWLQLFYSLISFFISFLVCLRFSSLLLWKRNK